MELEKQLAELKSALEKSFDEKAKKEIADKIKEVTEAIEKEKTANADKLKAIEVKADEADKAAKKAQAELDAYKAEQGKKGLAGQKEVKSFGDVAAKAVEDSTDDLNKFIRGERKSFAIELDLKAVADFSTENVTGGTVYGAQYRNGIIMNPNQIGHMRQIIRLTGGDASATDFYFMRENGVGEGAPAPTSEKKSAAATTQATGLKPQFDMDLVESSVKYETIAGFAVASRKSLRTIPSILQFINSRVPEKLLDVEDAQVLYGNGTSPNIKGILTSGNFVAGSAAGTTPLAEKIINDISTMEDTHKRVVNFGVLRPTDYWSLFKNKASGSGEYDLPQNVVFVNGVLYIGGVPFFKSTALTANDYFLGDSLGAEILQGESMRIEFFEQDGTNVRTNQVTVRIEETIALPVYGSNYFIKGSSALA